MTDRCPYGYSLLACNAVGHPAAHPPRQVQFCPSPWPSTSCGCLPCGRARDAARARGEDVGCPHGSKACNGPADYCKAPKAVVSP